MVRAVVLVVLVVGVGARIPVVAVALRSILAFSGTFMGLGTPSGVSQTSWPRRLVRVRRPISALPSLVCWRHASGRAQDRPPCRRFVGH